MADIIWGDLSQDSKNRIQAEAIGMTTANNTVPNGGYLISTGGAPSRTILNSAIGEVIVNRAINKVFETATSADSSVTQFDGKFKTMIGDPVVAPQDWTALQQIESNIIKAIVALNNKLSSIEIGSITIDELPVTA